MLYALRLGNRWGMIRNKRKALKLAGQYPGAEVWARADMPEVSAWDWPTFMIGAKRIY